MALNGLFSQPDSAEERARDRPTPSTPTTCHFPAHLQPDFAGKFELGVLSNVLTLESR